MKRYQESVYAARWMRLLVALSALATIGATVPVVFGDDGSKWFVVASLILTGAILGLVEFTFMRLRIDVTRDQMRFHFGPFGPTLKLSDVRSAEPSPYRWLAFGGWGIRFGRVSGRTVRAYSVPFIRTGVAIETAGGTRYYTSSQRPEALAAAILEGRTQEGPA
ncbi:MAG: hypothetical protein AB7L91_08550 [Dehalococcoidia bacterium]